VVQDGRSLTELPQVGPWLAWLIDDWLEHPPDPIDPPDIRRGFLSRAEARATLAVHHDVGGPIRSDLQMHTAYSDGRASLREMVEAAGALGYTHVAITDHSKGLPIAHGMDEATLARQAADIATLNQELERTGVAVRALHSIEMNLSPTGEGDMDPAVLSSLDLVLGAFHSKLRVTDDETDRYLAPSAIPTCMCWPIPVAAGTTCGWGSGPTGSTYSPSRPRWGRPWRSMPFPIARTWTWSCWRWPGMPASTSPSARMLTASPSSARWSWGLPPRSGPGSRSDGSSTSWNARSFSNGWQRSAHTGEHGAVRT
jgi:hypothetical protein